VKNEPILKTIFGLQNQTRPPHAN